MNSEWTPERAARLIARMAWPNERVDHNAAWSVRLINEPEMRNDEFRRAVEQNMAALSALLDAKRFLDELPAESGRYFPVVAAVEGTA